MKTYQIHIKLPYSPLGYRLLVELIKELLNKSITQQFEITETINE